jgi:hypothetical protein
MFHTYPVGATVMSILLLWVTVLIVIVLLTVFWIVQLVDILRREFPDPTTKLIWFLAVILLHALGAIIYVAVGKQQGRLPNQPPRVV